MRLSWVMLALVGLLSGWAAGAGVAPAGGWRLIAPDGVPTPVWLELSGACQSGDVSRRDRRGGGPDAAWVCERVVRLVAAPDAGGVRGAGRLAASLACGGVRCTRGPPLL